MLANSNQSAQTATVDFQPIGKRVQVPLGTSLWSAAEIAGIRLTSACGAEGFCGQCRVVPLQGAVTPPNDDEEFMLTEIELQSGERLACMTQVLGDVKVHIPRRSLAVGQRLQVGGEARQATVDSPISVYPVKLQPPTLDDLRSDLRRVLDVLQRAHGVQVDPAGVDLDVLRQLSSDARKYNWSFQVLLHDDELIGIMPDGARPLGLAVDLGTTKLAAYLVDLVSGEELASGGAPNPQIGYGEDVISRLNHVRRNPQGGQLLAEKLYETFNELLEELLGVAGADRCQVADCCIVGNTAMTHLLLGLPVAQLAVAPYVASSSEACDVRARRLQLEMAPGAYVHVPPGIGGFVGADHVAMILASDLDAVERVSLGVDIGTNTEIVLARPGQGLMQSASCASGPAFEGAHIHDGMRAAEGAIEAVTLSEHDVQIETIGDVPPVGLCGSGIIDMVAELHRWGLINERGRFLKEHPRLRRGERGPEFVITPAARSGSGRDVVMDQHDVNEIQLAKGAIRAGLEALLKATDTAPEAVEQVIVAGAFGSYLNLERARAIGMFPHMPQAEYRQVGNAAGAGAKLLLLSRAERQRARRMAAQVNYLELTTFPQFNRIFALSMLFPKNGNNGPK